MLNTKNRKFAGSLWILGAILVIAYLFAFEISKGPTATANDAADSLLSIECIGFKGEEFVSIINNSSEQVDLKGWYLTDIDDGFPSFTFPEYILIQGESVRVYTSELSSDEEGTFSFNREGSIWADANPDKAGLFSPDNILMSSRTYPPGCGDGERTPENLTEPVGLEIVCISYRGVRANESDEYVRIRNTQNEPINLEGWQLQDIDDGRPTFTFPSHEIAPNSTIRVYTNQIHPRWGGFSFGSRRSIWSNSENTPDTAGLFTPHGALVSVRSYPQGCHNLDRSTESSRVNRADPLTPEIADLRIVCIAYKGEEFVRIRNNGENTAQLEGWRLTDIADEGPTFIFPETTLLAGEVASVYTRMPPEGSRNAFSFGRSGSVWADRDPDEAGLFSPDGTLVSRKTYPPGCDEEELDDNEPMLIDPPEMVEPTTPVQTVTMSVDTMPIQPATMPVDTMPDMPDATLEIVCIAYKGEEFVRIRNNGENTAQLEGWRLTDIADEGPTFMFPETVLLAGEVASVYTRMPPEGSRNAFSFGRLDSIWADRDPDEAGLFSPDGTLVSRKTYPPGCDEEELDDNEPMLIDPPEMVEPTTPVQTVTMPVDTVPMQPVTTPVDTTPTIPDAMLEIICVDFDDEFVIIRNNGEEVSQLKGWRLAEKQVGKMNLAIFEFTLSYSLPPGETVTVYSSSEDENALQFGRSNIWNNRGGDSAELYSPDGTLVSESETSRICPSS